MTELKDNKKIFADNLNYYLSINNKTQSNLVEDLHLTASTVSDWANGKKYPRVDKMQMLADYFKILKSDLTEPPKRKKKKFVVPVLGKVIAGYPMEAFENIIDYEEISEDMARTGEFFALQVKGDSMLPRFAEGDIVIVKKQEDIDNGDIAIMMVNGNEATIKKIQKHEWGINLIPLNSAYETMSYSNKDVMELPVRCLGKVVELRAKF